MDQMQQPYMPVEGDAAYDNRGRMPAQQRVNPQPQAQMPPQGMPQRRGNPTMPHQPIQERDLMQRNRQQGGPQGQKRREEENADSLLNRMEQIVANARKLPLSGQCTIDRDEMLFLIKMVREGLPEELRQAKWLLQQNRQLIAEARKEAESIMRDAEQQMAKMIDEHEITQKANEVATHLINEADAAKQQIQQQAIDYVRQMLGLVEKQLTDSLLQIQKSKKNLEP